MRLLIAAVLALPTVAFAQETPTAPVPPPLTLMKGAANMIDANGTSIGTVTLADGTSGVLLRFEANGLTPGWHGTHLHMKGDCSDMAAGFKASGAHVGHGGGAEHGLLNPKGPETGDLPNIYAAENGTAKAEIFLSGMKVVDLVDADGTAIIIHANQDDHMSQPIGGAGDRVACGVIAKSE
jgi:Cu-Zn family superoxide dismutase